MSTPSKKRHAARVKIFGHSITVQCQFCRRDFYHNIGTLDPAEARCRHNWKYNPYRGPRGGIECTNEKCGLFIDDRDLMQIKEEKKKLLASYGGPDHTG